MLHNLHIYLILATTDTDETGSSQQEPSEQIPTVAYWLAMQPVAPPAYMGTINQIYYENNMLNGIYAVGFKCKCFIKLLISP